VPDIDVNLHRDYVLEAQHDAVTTGTQKNAQSRADLWDVALYKKTQQTSSQKLIGTYH